MINIIFLVLCSGIVGAYLAKPDRGFGETIIMVLNLAAILANALTLAGMLHAPVA